MLSKREKRQRLREYMYKHYWEGPKIRNKSKFLMRKRRVNNEFREFQKKHVIEFKDIIKGVRGWKFV